MGGVELNSFLTVLNSGERAVLEDTLRDQYGVETLPNRVYLETNKEKVYVVSHGLRDIAWEQLRIDRAGVYVGKWLSDGFRPSVEGAQLFGPLASKNVVELGKQGLMDWLKGRDVDTMYEDSRFVLVRYQDDFVGGAKMKNGTLLNSVSKARKTVTLIA